MKKFVALARLCCRPEFVLMRKARGGGGNNWKAESFSHQVAGNTHTVWQVRVVLFDCSFLFPRVGVYVLPSFAPNYIWPALT